MFGERVLAKVRGANGDDKFEVGCWLGKTDRDDFHMVATAKGLKWTRTIRRLPTPFDAEALHFVKGWPWAIGFGQIGAKASALMAKFPSVPVPPAVAPEISAEEREEARKESDFGEEASERRRHAHIFPFVLFW